MPANKSQHFVPQFYLRNFAFDRQQRSVRCYLVEQKRHISSTAIKNQSARDYLYGRDGEIEAALGELESEAARVIRSMVDGEVVPSPLDREFGVLTRFAVYQAFRTKRAGERYRTGATLIARQLAAAIYVDGTDKEREVAAGLRVELPDPVVTALSAATGWAPIVSDLRLKLLVNDSAAEFVTSDAPSVLHNTWCHRTRRLGSLSACASGLQIFLPISPRHLALWFDPAVYRVGDPGGDLGRTASEAEVASINELQMALATNCIYYRASATAAHVDQLVGVERDPDYGLVSKHHGHPRDGKTYLVMHHFPPRVAIKPGVIRLRDDAAMVPLRDREGNGRPEAEHVAEHLRRNPVPQSQRPRPGRKRRRGRRRR